MNIQKLHDPRAVPQLDIDGATELAEIFRLMGDPSRLRIILACSGEPICVGDVAGQLELPQSLVSHHLRLLRAARLVRAERRGKQIFYCLADAHVRCVIADMVEHVNEPAEES